jgi:hypothetical protein
MKYLVIVAMFLTTGAMANQPGNYMSMSSDIDIGMSQGQGQGQGQGQSQVGGNQSVTLTNTSPAKVTIRNTPALAAVISYPTAVCMGTSGGGVSGTAFGLNFGTSWSDEECKSLRLSDDLWNRGMKEDSIVVLCQVKRMKDAPSCQPGYKFPEPIAVVEPVKPIAVVEPVKPVTVVEPVKPVTVVEPVKPVAIVEPVKPVAIVEHIKPVAVSVKKWPKKNSCGSI